MASLTDINAPGAYPVTPLNEEPTDRNGQGKGTDQSGHNLADAGIYMEEPSLSQGPGPVISSYQNPPQQTRLDKETIPRSFGGGARSDLNHPSGSGAHTTTNALPFSHESVADKSSLPTGAYDKVGTSDSAFAQPDNYAYDNMTASSSQPPYGGNSQRRDETKTTGAAMGLGLGTPTNTPAGVTPLGGPSIDATTGDRADRAERDMEGNTHNKHSEPYWGDIPFGTGIYNGVTGHGSNESHARQSSLRDRYNSDVTTEPSGIYNGVTGHGSKGSAGPQVLKRDRNTITTSDHSSHQRAFPPSDDAEVINTTATSKLENADGSKRDSHAGGLLAGAGVAAAGGYTAHKLSHKDDNKGGNTTNKMKGEEKPLPYRPFIDADEETRSKGKSPEKYSHSTEHQMKESDNSNLGLLGTAGVAGAAGAGAYGVYKHANRDSSAKEHQSLPENEVSPSALASRDTTTGLAQQPHYNKLSGGTSSGLAGSGAQMTTAERPSTDSSDSSHGGLYNVLSSGTPSGINLEHAHSPVRH